jgi:AraC-like DNA-binding protein
MHIALARLRSHDEGIGALAACVGYQSEAAFSRAFKRFVGVAPGSVQREAPLKRREGSTRPRSSRAA